MDPQYTITAQVNTKKLDNLTEELALELANVVLEAALFLEREAKILAPVDTGNLRNSIYVVSFSNNGYTTFLEQQGDAQGSYAGSAPVPQNPFEAYLGVGASYGIHVEFGHQAGSSYVPGVFYVGRAVELTQPFFTRRVEEALSK